MDLNCGYFAERAGYSVNFYRKPELDSTAAAAAPDSSAAAAAPPPPQPSAPTPAPTSASGRGGSGTGRVGGGGRGRGGRRGGGGGGGVRRAGVGADGIVRGLDGQPSHYQFASQTSGIRCVRRLGNDDESLWKVMESNVVATLIASGEQCSICQEVNTTSQYTLFTANQIHSTDWLMCCVVLCCSHFVLPHQKLLRRLN